MIKNKYLILAVLVIGLGSFMFLVFDTSLKYSDNASFCINCHSMQESYDSWQSSNHKQFKCTECHAPQSYTSKASFKIRSGLKDLYVTTLGDIPQVFEVTKESKGVIDANCARCHYSTVESINMGQGQFCTGCHGNLVHERERN